MKKEIDRKEYRKEGWKEWYVEKRAEHCGAIMLSQRDSHSVHPSVCPSVYPKDGHTDGHPSFEW
jgi:hypothetical protein